MTTVGMEARWVLSSVVHALVLAMQFVVTLAVFSALMWVAVTQKGNEDVEFWEWYVLPLHDNSVQLINKPISRLWTFAEPSLVAILLFCSSSLIAHEVKVLSSVALLYLQSGVLALSTASSAVLWARCLGERSGTVKGVLMACNVLMFGMALFGFARAVVVWRVAGEWEEREEREREGLLFGEEGDRGGYGTVRPWYEDYYGRGSMV